MRVKWRDGRGGGAHHVGVTELGQMLGNDPNLALSVLYGLARWVAGGRGGGGMDPQHKGWVSVGEEGGESTRSSSSSRRSGSSSGTSRSGARTSPPKAPKPPRKAAKKPNKPRQFGSSEKHTPPPHPTPRPSPRLRRNPRPRPRPSPLENPAPPPPMGIAAGTPMGMCRV